MKYIIFFLFILSTIACQPEKGFLALKQKTDSVIGPNEAHRYQVKLNKDQFCILVVQQQGIDLILKLISPEGDTLNNIDSPNGKWGPEIVIFFSETKGIYTLQVQPLDKKAPKGKYSIECTRKEPKGRTPEKQVDQLFRFA